MNRFNYKAKDKDGRLVTGEVEANTINEAAKLVRGKGLYIISINPKIDSPLNLIKRIQERITPGDISTFTDTCDHD